MLKDLTNILKSVPIISFLVIIASLIAFKILITIEKMLHWKNQKPESRQNIYIHTLNPVESNYRDGPASQYLKQGSSNNPILYNNELMIISCNLSKSFLLLMHVAILIMNSTLLFWWVHHDIAIPSHRCIVMMKKKTSLKTRIIGYLLLYTLLAYLKIGL